jgi:hypothetical protein
MGSQDEQSNIATNMINDSLQDIANYCSISCNNNISNQDIVINGGNATIDLSQSCSAVGSECMIKNLVNTQIKNMIDNIVKQTESNLGIFSLMGPSSNEGVNITNGIKNQISQVINNTCAPSINNNDTNNNIFAQDANLNLIIGQTGNINNAQCALDTVSKMVINNSVTNSVTQSESSCKDVILILIIIIIVCILILVWPILRALSKRTASTIEGKNKNGVNVNVNDGVNVNVDEAFYKKTWFKVLMGVIAIAIIGIIIYVIVRDIRKKDDTKNMDEYEDFTN